MKQEIEVGTVVSGLDVPFFGLMDHSAMYQSTRGVYIYLTVLLIYEVRNLHELIKAE